MMKFDSDLKQINTSSLQNSLITMTKIQKLDQSANNDGNNENLTCMASTVSIEPMI